jgi:energy-coupling factor transporter ATP-binding protein EcfA2
VHDILTDLGLDTCKNTLIQSISGGQKRRLALASALLTNSYYKSLYYFDA